MPAGAIPKDGPSAGVTMATAIVSALQNQPVREDVAMTGEITLSGLVLPVGGIREKALAARRHGIKTFILPARNDADLAELPPEVRDDDALRAGARRSEEVLKVALPPTARGVVEWRTVHAPFRPRLCAVAYAVLFAAGPVRTNAGQRHASPATSS